MEAALKTPEALGVAVDRREVIAAFRKFADEQPYEELSDEANAMIGEALEELIELKTYQFDEWYIRNHHRFRHLREMDRRRAREVARAFIGQVQLGRIAF